MLKRLLLLLLFLPVPQLVSAQHKLEGRVIDSQTQESLPFVNILINGGRSGVISDIDGRFSINHPAPIDFLQLSYVGYEALRFEVVAGIQKVRISMQKKAFGLEEVAIVAGENPAHRVVREAVRQRDNNNPERLNSFSYTAYNRFVVTLDTSVRPLVDTVSTRVMKRRDRPDSLVVDSTNLEVAQFFRQRDIFLSESVSERSFRAPNLSQEQIIATRTSGIENPIFLLLSTQFQSFSFYDDYISLLQIRLLNPISPGSTSRYFFHLEDTLYDGADSIYVLSFKPRKGSNFAGMKGLVYIHTNGYAIQNVIAEPADSLPGLSLRLRQHYELVDGQKWFPTQLNTDIIMQSLALGGPPPAAFGYVYLSNIVINPPLRRRDIGLHGTEILRDATNKPIGYWEPFRPESQSERDQETYRFIDSISAEYKLERRLRYAMAVSTGRLPVGPVDVRLRDVIGGNRHEGFRLGIGLETNEKLSRWFALGGYAAWGFRDKTSKYGLNADVFFDPRKKYSLSFFRHNDLVVNGGYSLFNNHTGLINTSPDQLVHFFNRYFDREQAAGARFRFLNVRYLSGDVSFKSSYRQATGFAPYRYLPLLAGTPGSDAPATVAAPSFQYRELGVHLRYAFREKTLRLADREYTVENRYPVVYLSYQRGLQWLGGDWDYHRLVMRVEKDFEIRHAGILTAVVSGGAVFSESSLPMQQLFYMRGVGRNNGFMVPLNFQTFDMYDYAGNQFAQLNLRHNFESLLFKTPKQQPIFALHHNIGFSWLQAPADHFFLGSGDFVPGMRDLRHGFHESGLSLSNILILGSRWGVGVFYRYGAYSDPSWQNNLAVKLALTP